MFELIVLSRAEHARQLRVASAMRRVERRAKRHDVRMPAELVAS